jgi:alpha-tubulin suppressor-like RCC1 family protein
MTFGSRCREDLRELFLTEEELIDRVRPVGLHFSWGSVIGGTACCCFPVELCFTINDFSKLYGSPGPINYIIGQGGTEFSVTGCTQNSLVAVGCNRCGILGDNTVTLKGYGAGNLVCGNDAVGWSCVGAGFCHVLAVKNNGTLWGWGDGLTDCALGGSLLQASVPTQITNVVSVDGWKSAFAGDRASWVIDQSDNLYFFGRNTWGLGGVNSSSSVIGTPTLVGQGYKQVGGGCEFAVFLKTDGTLWTAGDNVGGKLGVGNANTFGVSTYRVSSPIQITSPNKHWKCISVSTQQAVALSSDGEIWFWGLNNNCNSGVPGLISGTGVGASCPVLVGTNYRRVSIGPLGGAGIRTDGRLYTWGSQTGNDPFLGRSSNGAVVSAGPCNCVGFYNGGVVDVIMTCGRIAITVECNYGVN